MTISIIHPSYGRPKLAFNTASNWIKRAQCKIEYILCLSEKDPTDYWFHLPFGVKVITCEDANMVKQMNQAAKESTGDLIIAVSDDFDCPDQWDQQLINNIAGRKDFALQVDDGLNHPGIKSDNIMAIPMMDRIFYERLGYIYHPEYNHFFGDEELCRMATIMGKKIKVPVVFPHIHFTVGKAKKDKVNEKNSGFYAGDKLTFARREEKGFDLKTLSILIPTLKNRAHLLNGLIDELQTQIENLNAEKIVQIIKFTDSGEKSIGEKRNWLVKHASGDYVSFIDDDDRPTEDYIRLLLGAIQDNPDCCSLNGMLSVNGNRGKLFVHSIAHKGWYEENGVLYRYPNHLNCIKREIAMQVPFPEISHGEDRAYSDQLYNSGLLKTEAVINPILYKYNYVSGKRHIAKI